MKADLLLFQKGLARSRTHAQDLIREGCVYFKINGIEKLISKPSQQLDAETEVFIKESSLTKYVSRGGLKLESALQITGLIVFGKKCLDVGLSTGGFSDCLLQAGADSVVGVDVGTEQLHPSLRENSRLIYFDHINARTLSECEPVKRASPGGGFDLVVMDVSFISIDLIIPELVSLIKPGGYLLSLVKPQFEVGAGNLSKGGIVKNNLLFEEVEKKICEMVRKNGFQVLKYFSSGIEGKDGNQEFFVFAKKA